jgi:hypothetical protein
LKKDSWLDTSQSTNTGEEDETLCCND